MTSRRNDAPQSREVDPSAKCASIGSLVYLGVDPGEGGCALSTMARLVILHRRYEQVAHLVRLLRNLTLEPCHGEPHDRQDSSAQD